MAEQWFYSREGQPKGPLTFAEIVALAQAGEIAPTELVWQEGTPDWRRAADVPGLFAPAAATSAMPLPLPPRPVGAPPQGLQYAQPVAPLYYSGGGHSYASEARTAMIISIIGIFCVGIVLGPIGFALGYGARKNMRISGNLEGEGMAIAAMVIGGIIMGLAALGILFLIAAAALGA
jgi:hypothetical protein